MGLHLQQFLELHLTLDTLIISSVSQQSDIPVPLRLFCPAILRNILSELKKDTKTTSYWFWYFPQCNQTPTVMRFFICAIDETLHEFK